MINTETDFSRNFGSQILTDKGDGQKGSIKLSVINTHIRHVFTFVFFLCTRKEYYHSISNILNNQKIRTSLVGTQSVKNTSEN